MSNKTNFEKIKEASLEELAELLNCISDNCYCCAFESTSGCFNANIGCIDGIKLWLTSEVVTEE